MTNETSRTSRTQAHAPDLDWSQIRETVLMMELATGQIEAAMKDSGSSVNVLTEVFTSMAGHMRQIDATLKDLPASSMPEATRGELLNATGQVAGMVHQAIIAFQFYDKLVQRLSHVNHSIDALADLVGDKSRIYSPAEWVLLQQQIRSKYTMREESEMFDAVLGGMSVKEALDNFMTKMQGRSDDIELF